MLITLSSIIKGATSLGYCRFKAPFCCEVITQCPYPCACFCRVMNIPNKFHQGVLTRSVYVYPGRTSIADSLK